jgi:4-hydroxyphenylacetate 3-monooxygenase
MLKSGKEHLEGLRDGRVVYIGSEQVKDVTTHPAFRNAASTVAALYDMKADPAHRDVMTYEEDGDRHSIYFLRPRTREDLARRSAGHCMIADMTYGMFGRSPDHVASFVSGLAMKPEELRAPYGFAENLLKYYRELRARDLYVVYAVLPPQAARDPEFYQRQNLPMPTLSVVREEDDGLIISGMKLLATGAVLADEVWIGNVLPLAPDQKKQAVTCSIPCNAPGLSLWSRKPFAREARTEFDSPLTYRFDETDSMVMCDEVKVPWERVFVHDDAILSREIYIKTPGHCLGNHQSNVRYWSKMRLLLGLCSKVANATGAAGVPAVKELLGQMASFEAMIAGMVNGQIEACERWPGGYVCFNRRMMYAALEWCTQNYSGFIDKLRELCGGGVFQMPADISVLENEELAGKFTNYFQTPQVSAVERMKLFKLAWDMVGSEFAGRHLQYEKFYAGASFIVRGHAYRETPWEEFHKIVDDLMASYGVPDAGAGRPPGEFRAA